MVGVIYALLAFVIQSSVVAAVKYVGTELPTVQVVCSRFLIGFLFCLVLAHRRGGITSVLPNSRWSLHILRGLLGLGAVVCFYYAIPLISLADYTALGFTNPLMLALLGWWFLREDMPLMRWAAIACGVVGVLLVVKPGFETVSYAVLVMLLGCLLAASSDIVVRILSRSTESLTIVSTFFGISALISSIALIWVWKTPSSYSQWIVLFLVGIGSVLFQLLWTKALAELPASAASPFSYTQIVWALLFDILLWKTYPDTLGMVGTAFIMADGILAYVSILRVEPETAPS